MEAVLLAVALVLPAAAAPAQDRTFFRTPLGNIHCLGGQDEAGAFVDCEIRKTDRPGPIQPRPVDCDLDWGSRFTLEDIGMGQLACHGDTVQTSDSLVLPYGRSVSFGSVTCTSAESGLECRNVEGHGFALSRARQSVF